MKMQGKEGVSGAVAIPSARLARWSGVSGRRLVLYSDEVERLENIERWDNVGKWTKVDVIRWGVKDGANFTYRDRWSGKWANGYAPVEWLVQAKANCLPHVAEAIVCALCSGSAVEVR